MKKIEIEIPEGKNVEWVNGVLTLVDEPKKHYEFEVGDKAFLNKDLCFTQASGDFSLVKAGAEVEITEITDKAGSTEKIYDIKYQNFSTSVVYGSDLDKIEFKFNVGDRVTLVGFPLAVFTIVSQIVKDGKLYYGVEGRPNCLPYEESELMPYQNKKVKHKFNINDKVRLTNVPDSLTYTIKAIGFQDGGYIYTLNNGTTKMCVAENLIDLISQDITERIKTLEDACKWCNANGKKNLVEIYRIINFNLTNSSGGLIVEEDKDILAYLKLRIITAALNEGWEPTYETSYTRYVPFYNAGIHGGLELSSGYCGDSSCKLCFKTEDLAAYAANQFKDIYADFCGCRKGGDA